MTTNEAGTCQKCSRDLNPEQIAAGMTEHIHHALQDAFFAAIVTGPCSICGAPHPLYGPTGKPLCDDCDPRLPEEAA